MAMLKVGNYVKLRNLLSTSMSYNNKNNILPVFRNLHDIGSKYTYGHKSSESQNLIYDVVVIGGGIIGVATARELLMQYPSLKIGLLEKEDRLAFHQSGHNSGVIHAGIYYKPDSLKAQLCVKGLHLMYKYCDEKSLPYKKCGKLIVATDEVENGRLDDLIERGKKNNVPDMKVVESDGIKKIEPSCQGVRAIWSPHTGITDYAKVTEQLACDFKDQGGKVHLNFQVDGFQPNLVSESESERVQYPLEIVDLTAKLKVKASYVVACAGLLSDKLAVMSGCKKDPKIVPIRGEYMLLSKDKAKLIQGNIYPVPDPKYPFLGVHFTRRMDGSVWLGPNAVLAFKREGYQWNDFSIGDFMDAVTYPGFIKLASANAKFGVNEMVKSINLKKQIRNLQKFIPEITVKDVKRGPAGVRAQALDSKGNLIDDFVFDMNPESEVGRRVLHCRNAPSPGATSSLAIAQLIAERAKKEFSLSEK